MKIIKKVKPIEVKRTFVISDYFVSNSFQRQHWYYGQKETENKNER
jgi:hypothetical protein